MNGGEDRGATDISKDKGSLGNNPEVVTEYQGTPSKSHQGGAGAYLNPEGGTLPAAPPRGRDYYDTSATSGDTI